MSIDLVPRKEWQARSPSGAYSKMPPTVEGVKVHYTGGFVSPSLLTNHKLCELEVREIQAMHMDSRDWLDIGYSMCVCPHRKVFVGRGVGVIPAANGPGLNSNHYAVLGLVGNSGLTEPNDAMIAGIRDAITYLRKYGRAGNDIKGHRDGYATDCPGSLYTYVRNGTFEPNSGMKEDPDMPSYLSISMDEKQPLELPASEWKTLAFDVEYADPDGMHASGRFPSFLTGKARFVTEIAVAVVGLEPGVEGQIRLYEVDAQGDVSKSYAIKEWRSTPGKTYVQYVSVGTVDAGSKLRVKMVHFGSTTAVVESCSAKVLYWT